MKHRTVIAMTAGAGPAVSGRLTGVPKGRPVVLRDGSAVLIRQVRSTDAPLLADGFARLSAASRQMRFLGVKIELSAAELRYFTDVDHHDHEALVALDRSGQQGVGIARFIRDADDPQAAEIAVTIVDKWQAGDWAPSQSRFQASGSCSPQTRRSWAASMQQLVSWREDRCQVLTVSRMALRW